MRRAVATRVRRIPDRMPGGVRPAILVGAWLALTGLFVFGSVVLVGTVVAALGETLPVVATLVALVGVLGASGAAPVVSQAVVAAAADRFDAAFDRDATDDLFTRCEMKGQANCRPSRGRCC